MLLYTLNLLLILRLKAIYQLAKHHQDWGYQPLSHLSETKTVALKFQPGEFVMHVKLCPFVDSLKLNLMAINSLGQIIILMDILRCVSIKQQQHLVGWIYFRMLESFIYQR